MKILNLKKVLFGLAISLVLAMAIGSFAIGDNQTPVTPQATAQNEAVSATYDDFEVSGDTSTISFSNSVLTISGGEHTISMAQGVESTSDRIEVTGSATITLAGVNISTSTGSAMDIDDSANVTVLLADGYTNILTATSDDYAGLQKNGGSGVGMLTISGTGQLTANGGQYGAGIGSGYDSSTYTVYDVSNITISGGTVTAKGGTGGSGIGSGIGGNGSNITISGNAVVTATGGSDGAGIGGGQAASGSDITISGGTVTAKGGNNAAGIGGGSRKSGSNITITGGTVTATGGAGGAGIGGGSRGNGTNITISGGSITATGGYAEEGSYKFSGAGIGGGSGGNGSNNSIAGDNVVVIAQSGDTSKDALEGFGTTIDKGLIFTNGQETSGNWSGNMYNNITLSESLKIPAGANLTIPEGKTLSINEEKALTVPDGSTLKNDGTLTIKGTLSCTGAGKVETLLNYDPQGGAIKTNDDNYITYQDAGSIKKYENLPEATKEGYDLEGWYTKAAGQGTKVEEGDDVLLNQHMLYANWVEPAPTPTPPTPTPPGPEPGPEPEPTPEPTPDPSVDPDGGDGSGSGASSKTSDPFMGGIALALLGVATTGAILTRKFK